MRTDDRATGREPRAGSSQGLPPGLPFAHFRLAVFFLAVASVVASIGAWSLRDRPGDATVLAVCVFTACTAGFLGVLFHRRRVIPLRWKETEEYLEAIERESRKYRALMEGAADMLLLVEPSTGAIREWNASARVGFDWPVDRPPPSVEALLAGDALALVRSALDDVRSEAGSVHELGELRARTHRGRELVLDARQSSVEVEDGRVALLALRDVTRQKTIERELQVRDRLSSIGLLTAGVTHEINNPLEGIGNYLMLAERTADDAERRSHLEQVRHGFDRIRDLVRDLLRFARPDPGESRADLTVVVERALALTAYSGRFGDVAVERAGLDDPIQVVGDANRLEQVVLNLLINAANAMGGKGRVTVRATIARDGDAPPAVDLAIEDTGPGIPADALDRLFDPFYSTTGGTGLGLAVSYGIVSAHGGSLRAANLPGGGARFTIHLPLLEER